jgi:hypothetical protein
MNIEVVGWLASGLLTVLCYLLKQKDDKQQKALDTLEAKHLADTNLLFKKHDDDAAALQELRVQIAEGHYKKGELDTRFDKLEGTIKISFDSLGSKFDRMSEALMSHVTAEAIANHGRRASDKS